MTEIRSPYKTSGKTPADPALCSVVVVSYNSEADLPTCLTSLVNQSLHRSDDLEIIVVDNASTDGSVSLVQEHYPEVTLLPLGENRGYAGGNNVGFAHARGRYLAVMNPDCIAHRDCLSELVRALEADPRSGLATPKALLHDAPFTIDTCGLGIDASGYGAGRGYGKPCSTYETTEDVASVCGSCFVMRREVRDQLGGFDEAFFLYVEELDLSMRARLLGHNILFVPLAVVHHKYRSARSPGTFYYLERNRYQLLFKALTLRSLVCLLPGLLLNEMSVWGYALRYGRSYLTAKARANAWLTVHFRDLYQRRKRVQDMRRVPDHDVLGVMSPRMKLSKLQSERTARMANALIESVNQLCLDVASSMSRSRLKGTPLTIVATIRRIA